MKVTKNLLLTIVNGNYQLTAGQGLTTLKFNDKDVHVFRRNELQGVVDMLTLAIKELDDYEKAAANTKSVAEPEQNG